MMNRREIRRLTLIPMIAVLPALLFIPTRSIAQTLPGQQAADQDCAKIKQDIQQLQQDLANLSVEMQRLTEELDQLNKDVAQNQAHLSAGAAANSPWLTQEIRGQELDSLAKLLNLRRQVNQQIEDDTSLTQAIKDEIADLLSKLANCAPPSTTEPTKGQTVASGQSTGAPPSGQPPRGQPAPPSQTAPVQQIAGDQDCAKIKQDIQQLQQDLANLSVEMQRLTEELDQLNKDVAQNQAHLSAGAAANSPWLTQEIRGQELDSLAKLLNLRRQVNQQIEDDTSLTQAIKDEIADLLSKLANCGPPSTTQPPNQETPTEQPTPPPSNPPQKNKSVSMSGFTPTFQLRGFGGASFINGNTPATAGFDGAVLFPLGNHILVGPTAGFQWVNSSIVQTVGSRQPGSTFINTSAGFKQGNFGGRIQIPFMINRPTAILVDIHGGATVAGSSITQAEGFCGLGNATSPAGCTVLSTTNTHDTVVGPFVGGYISHSIFPHVGVFVGYDYFHPAEFKTSVSTLDLHYSDAVAGFNFTFGRH